MSRSERNRLFDLKGQQLALVCPKLAEEIGFNKSLLLLQLDYLIAISNHEKEGQRWTYQSVTDIEKMFPFLEQGDHQSSDQVAGESWTYQCRQL